MNDIKKPMFTYYLKVQGIITVQNQDPGGDAVVAAAQQGMDENDIVCTVTLCDVPNQPEADPGS